MILRILPLFVILSAGPALAGGYTFQSISDNSGPIDSYQGLNPAISNNGVVAFTATMDPPVANPPYVVFRYSPGGTIQVEATASSFWKTFGEPAISGDGDTITYTGALDDEDLTVSYFSQSLGRYVHSAPPAARLDESTHNSGAGVVNVDEFPSASEVGPGAANGGRAAYVVRLSERDPTPFSAKKRRVYLHNGSVRTLLLQDSTTRPASGGPNTPADRTPGFKTATSDWYFAGVNSSGVCAFRCRHPDIAFNVAGSQGIYTAGPSGIQTIMEEGIPYEPNKTFNTFKPYAINDAGQVLLTSNFLSNPPGGPLTSGSGLYLKGPGNSAPVLVAAGADFFVTKMAMSGNGRVAFRAQVFTPTSITGIFDGPHPVNNRIIAVGDSLFGSTVADLSIQRNAINNSGQIAFYYRLNSGVRGIAIASPPLPSLNHTVTGSGASQMLNLWWTEDASATLMASPDLVSWTAVAGPFGTSGINTTHASSMGQRLFYRLIRP